MYSGYEVNMSAKLYEKVDRRRLAEKQKIGNAERRERKRARRKGKKGERGERGEERETKNMRREKRR